MLEIYVQFVNRVCGYPIRLSFQQMIFRKRFGTN